MQIRIVSRFWFFRRPRRLKINIRRSSVYFRKSHVCANKLDVQETDFSFTQFYRCGNNFSWCRFTNGRYARSYSLGFGDWNISFCTKKIEQPKEELRGNPLQATKPNMHNPIKFKHTNGIPTNIDHIPSNTMHSGSSATLCMSLRTVRQ